MGSRYNISREASPNEDLVARFVIVLDLCGVCVAEPAVRAC